MKHYLLALLLAASSALAQTPATGDYLFSKRAATGPNLSQWLAPNANDLLGWNGSGALANVPRSTFALATDALSLSVANQWAAQQSFSAASTTGAININPTWNTPGTPFTAFRVSVTNINSDAQAALADFIVGGTSRVRVNAAGKLQVAALNNTSGVEVFLNNYIGNRGINFICHFGVPSVTLSNNGGFAFSSSADAGAGGDVSMFRHSAAVLSVRGSSTTTGGAINLLEMTAPSAPAANQVSIYAEDNGSGKTRLMARFPSGAAQQIAIEP